MLFSIIIPTFNRPEMLALCLAKLDPVVQQFNENEFEIIVSDDGAVFNIAKTLQERFKKVFFIQGPQKGPAENRNNGAKHANGKWLIFLDDDCIPDNEILNGYKDALEKYNTVKAFEGRIYTNETRTRLDEESPINEEGGLFWSCNIMVEYELFQSMNGFDKDFPYACMEDIDLRERIGTENIRFVTNAAVLHPLRRVTNFKSVYKKKWISHKIFYNKHPQYPNFQKGRYFKNVLISIKNNLNQNFRFKFKGYRYSLNILKFQFRFLMYLLSR